MQNSKNERIKEIDRELSEIRKTINEYHSRTDKNGVVWQTSGKHNEYQKLVDREDELLAERKTIMQESRIQGKGKFFIPNADNPEASECIYQDIKKSVLETMKAPISDRRIFSIKFINNGIRFECQVGSNANVHEVNDEVMAIYESPSLWYLICTPSRGIDPRFPTPIIVGAHDVIMIEDFET